MLRFIKLSLANRVVASVSGSLIAYKQCLGIGFIRSSPEQFSLDLMFSHVLRFSPALANSKHSNLCVFNTEDHSISMQIYEEVSGFYSGVHHSAVLYSF